MWCSKCNKQLHECTCPDLAESPFIHPQAIAKVHIDREQAKNRPEEKPEQN